MGLDQNRLGFLADTRSDPWIGDATGISAKKIEGLRSGTQKLTTRQTRNLRNAYQREAYGRARDAGMSSDQARRFSWYAPASTRERITAVQEKVEYLSKGAFTAMAADLDRRGEGYNEGDLFNEAFESVWEGFRNSKKPYEEWEAYP